MAPPEVAPPRWPGVTRGRNATDACECYAAILRGCACCCGARRRGRSAVEGRLDPGDVDLAHRHHRLERALGGGAVGVVERLDQHPRGDLPGHAPLVLAP